jgi:hypothetical protein
MGENKSSFLFNFFYFNIQYSGSLFSGIILNYKQNNLMVIEIFISKLN